MQKKGLALPSLSEMKISNKQALTFFFLSLPSLLYCQSNLSIVNSITESMVETNQVNCCEMKLILSNLGEAETGYQTIQVCQVKHQLH